MHFNFDTFVSFTVQNWIGFVVPNQRIFVLYLVTSLMISWLVWYTAMKQKGLKFKDFIAYVFPADIYSHRSSVQDYFIFLANGLLYYGILSQFVLSERPFAIMVQKYLISLLGPLEEPLLSGYLAMGLFTLANVLLYDFSVYVAHWLTHKVPALWAFHRVHHSAEVLTPITLFRMHPVDLFFNSVLLSFFTGLGLGVFSYLSMQEVSYAEVLSVNVVIFVFYLGGYNLRHSHVWLHYPRWLSWLLISPAQHQIHHSVEVKHMDKNMGLIFSFWDWMFGTLYTPETKEDIVFGIRKKERNPFTTVSALYKQPFVESYVIIRDKMKIGGWKHVAALACGFIGTFMLYAYLSTFANASLVAPVSLFTEELTWTEIRQAQKNGYDSVIIPIGGTEQGGPHIVTGKHNYIVHYTSGEIARRIGRTLVAPVIAYVPQGEITPKLTENMRWPGSIGVPPQVLEDTLYWAAMSFKAHGFKHIFFIGDHGPDQAPAQKAAERLAAEWKKDGVMAAFIGDYYSDKNGQAAWLKEKGYSEKDIGVHAAMRDTSELMAMHPEGVRKHPVIIANAKMDGVEGNPALASKETGEKMLELKINAAVAQIRALTKN